MINTQQLIEYFNTQTEQQLEQYIQQMKFEEKANGEMAGSAEIARLEKHQWFNASQEDYEHEEAECKKHREIAQQVLEQKRAQNKLIKTFVCTDCGVTYRSGMYVEHDFFLTYGSEIQNEGKRCVYCYNKKRILQNKLNPEWLIEHADRVQHENELIEMADLFLTQHSHHYTTNYMYELVLELEEDVVIAEDARKLLQEVGFVCGNIYGITNSKFTIEFKGYTRRFSR